MLNEIRLPTMQCQN